MTKTGKLKVAAVASNICYADVEKNLANIEKWSSLASEKGAKLVLFPEGSVSGYLNTELTAKNYGSRESLLKVAEPVPGKSTVKLESYAKKARLFICAGIAECDKDNIYNTQVLVGPDGYIGKYRKVHPAAIESLVYKGGTEFPVFDVCGFKVGINICADKSFPEAARIMAIKGAEIILMPHCTATGRQQPFPEWSRKIIIGRSMDNAVFSVVTNGILDIYDEKDENFAPAGLPFVIDPYGNVVSELTEKGGEEKMLVVELDSQLVKERRNNPNFNLNLRCPKSYHALVQEQD